MHGGKRIRLGWTRASALLLCGSVAALLVCPVAGKSRRDPAAETVAQSLMADADNLRAAFEEQSSRKALEKLAAARAYYQTAGDIQSQVRALATSAEILIDLSEYDAAVKSYQEQLRLSTSPIDRIRALNGLSAVYIYLGDQKKARAFCESATRLSRTTRDKEGEAESLINAGELYYFAADRPKALQAFNQALLLAPDKRWRGRARALLNLGYTYYDLRQTDAALDYYQQSHALSRETGNRRSEALALTAIAGVHSYLGNKDEALNDNIEAIALLNTIGDRNGEGVALNGLGFVYRNLGEYQKSLDSYMRALKLFQAVGTREYEIFTFTRIGKAYEALGDTNKALENYELAVNRGAKYPQTTVSALNSIGNIMEATGQDEKAARYYNDALKVYRKINDKMGEAAVLNTIAMLGPRGEGQLSTLRRALSISRQVKDRRGEVSVLLNIAKSLSHARDYGAARAAIEESLNLIESLRSEADSSVLRASYFSSVRQHYELYADIIMQSCVNGGNVNCAADALAVSERARARSFVEVLAQSQGKFEGIDTKLLARMHTVGQQLNAQAEQRMDALAHGRAEEAATIDRRIDELSADYDQIEGSMRSENASYAALTQPQTLSVNQIQQQVLDADSILLEYMLGDERSYLWLVTKTNVSAYELPPRAQIEGAVREFRELLTANQPSANETFQQHQADIREAETRIPEAAASLSDLLLGRVRDKLGAKRLLIVPDGALHYIPFQALALPSSTNVADRLPLLTNHEIVYEPSASALMLLLNERALDFDSSKSVAVFADPVFEADDARVRAGSRPNSPNELLEEPMIGEVSRDVGFSNGRVPRLPASREEAERILSMAPWGTGYKAVGFDANRAAVAQPELAHYRIVHFATHAFVDYEHPELSGLVLSRVDEYGNPRDGYLRLHDIYNLHLSANLVVLSACDTGLGKEIRGEGLIGLTRGFMYAGSQDVAASLWKVEDDATAELMAHFYEGIFRRNLTPSAAMREAQLWMWQQPRWHAPFYWAGFVIQGRYDQKQNFSPPNSGAQKVVTAAGLLSTLILMACLFVGRRRSATV